MKTSKQKPLDPKRFSALIHSGKNNTAVSSLDTVSKPLPLSDEVVSILREKHPKSEPIQQGSLLYGPVDDPVLTIANDITVENIKTAALHARGSAGPSGVDALNARRMICSNNFPKSRELCDGLVRFCRRLFTECVNPAPIASFHASRAVALDKNPGIRPVGIGDFFSSVIMKLMPDEAREVMGPLQTCAGHAGGIEATGHAMQQLYGDKETEGCLLIDAENAFNGMNRKVALRNIQVLCPKLSLFSSNT